MSLSGLLLVLTVLAPAAMLLACLSHPARTRMIGLLWLAPLPGLLAALLVPEGTTVVWDLPQARLVLSLDRPGALLLGVSALLWSAAGAYAAGYIGPQRNRGSFAVRWLLTLLGNMGVYIAADLLGFYLYFAIVSLAAYGLVVFDNTGGARRAAAIYLALAILGEAFLVFGFVLAAQGITTDSLLIRDAAAALPASAWRDPAMIMLLAGFGLKAGLVPLHVWLPVAHPAAPMPASAVLSGALVKAGVIGLIRFLPADAALADWGAALAAIGLVTAFYAVAMGIVQDNPKTVLAYSTASQMGAVATVIGAGLRIATPDWAELAAFYAAHHALAKGAMFLAVGLVAACGAGWRRPVLLLTGLVALGLAGLPLSGGALAKLAVKAPLGSGAVATLTSLSAAGTALLMLHFTHLLWRAGPTARTAGPPPLLWVPWLVLATGAVAVPWALFGGIVGLVTDAVQPEALIAASLPILLGAALWAAQARARARLPHIPEGDLVVLGEAMARRAGTWAAAIERVEAHARRWPIAGLSLLTLVAALCVTLLAPR